MCTVLFFTGEEVLLIQEKLDGIKTRYADITVTSSKALRTLEQARQLATKFHSTHEELTGWLREVEEELAASGGQSPTGEQIPQFQQRQKVSGRFTPCREKRRHLGLRHVSLPYINTERIPSFSLVYS